MTSTRIYDPADGAALPELPDTPPMSVATMAVGLTGMLDEAADLPQPRYISLHELQMIDLGFAPVPESPETIARWALRFGAVLVSEHIEATTGPCTYIHARFSYCGIAVQAYVLIPDPGGS